MQITDKLNSYDLGPKKCLSAVVGDPRLVVIDVETTGLDHICDRVIQFACIDTTAQLRKSLEGCEDASDSDAVTTYLNPEMQIPKDAQRIHRITDEMVRGAPLFKDVAGSFLKFIDGAILVGHNIKFDYEFINAELIRAGYPPITNPVFCTLKAARKSLVEYTDRFDLASVAQAVDIEHSNPHDALADATVTAKVLARLMILNVGQRRHDRHEVENDDGLMIKIFGVTIAIVVFVVLVILTLSA